MTTGSFFPQAFRVDGGYLSCMVFAVSSLCLHLRYKICFFDICFIYFYRRINIIIYLFFFTLSVIKSLIVSLIVLSTTV